MRKQPDWLEIQEYLYPQTLLQKTFQIQAPGLPLPIHLSATFTYHPENRFIDITQTINDVITDNLSPGTYEVYAYWRDGEKYISLGVHPFKQPVTLSGELMESSRILLRVQSRGRRSGEKTVREILEKVGQWRKIYEKGRPKCTLDEAAKQVGVCKNTLQDYYIKIKLGQKHGYNFTSNFQEPFKHLRKFVKTHHERKQQNHPVLSMLQKYQHK